MPTERDYRSCLDCGAPLMPCTCHEGCIGGMCAESECNARAPNTVDHRVKLGLLPYTLRITIGYRGPLLAAELYSGGHRHERSWKGFCRAWRGIAWVRCQAFQRDGEAEFEAEYQEVQR